MGLTHNRWRCEMKSYDEFKAEMETIQQQMVEAKKNNALWKFQICIN